MRSALFAAACCGVLAASAGAQPLSWSNPSGGLWTTPTNWSPVMIPGTVNEARIELPGSYSIRTVPGTSYCSGLVMTNPQAVLDIRMNETLRLGSTSTTVCRVDGTLLIGDGQFGNPAVLDAVGGAGPLSLLGAGRIVLNARRELVLPFATVRASGRTTSLAAGLRVEGRGALQCNVTCAGTIAPGLGAGGVGEIAVDTLTMAPTGVLEFDIAGPSINEFDRLQINFGSTRGGTLRVRLANGYRPPVGMVFFLCSGPLLGSFAAIDAPGFAFETGPSGIVVRYVGVCDPDVNADGNADQDDVAYLVNVIGGGENPSGADPDFNADGNADQDDVAALVATLAGAGCP